MAEEQEDFEIELDLEEALKKAAIALYEASDEYDFLVPFSTLPEDDRDGFEGAASVVLEAALPLVVQQVFDQVVPDED